MQLTTYLQNLVIVKLLVGIKKVKSEVGSKK